MDARHLFAEYPVPVVLTAATVLAAVWTLVQFAGPAPVTATIQAAALTTVLFVFAAGFWAGPLSERYDGGEEDRGW
jgi:hypothetical protein